MPSRSRSQPDSPTLRRTAILLSCTLIVGILYFAKVVLIPLALAVLLTFVLSPLVTRLDRWGCNRVVSVVGVVLVTGFFFAGLVWLVAYQLNSLAYEMPKHKETLREKLAAIHEGGQGEALERVWATLEHATRPMHSRNRLTTATQSDAADEPPVPVEIVPQDGPERRLNALWNSLKTLSPAVEGLATAMLAVVLLIFMLIQREDLRNRLVSLTANSSLATTTKALDDAGQRISRYLLLQLIINGSFGMAVWLGLWLIGVPYPFLWGLCAGVFRYLPYVGPWAAAILPSVVSLITSPGWTQVLLVLGLFLVLELWSNNLMEPWLYGQGIGVSVVALLVSATFWTWIWGPMGLVMATPLTVCLVVMGKYVPALAFFDKLLGDEPALGPHAVVLQRLLARDDREAADTIREYCAAHPPETVYDQVLLPALSLMRRDRRRGAMDAKDERIIIDSLREILAEPVVLGGERELDPLDPSHDSPAGTESDRSTPVAGEDVAGEGEGSAAESLESHDLDRSLALSDRTRGEFARGKSMGDASGPIPPRHPTTKVLGCTAHVEAEELTLEMLQQLVADEGLELDVLSTRTLPADIAEQVAEAGDWPIVVIAALPPGGLVQTRYLCKMLRRRFPELTIVVGCWQYQGDFDRVVNRLRSAGASYVTTTLLGARDHLNSCVAARLERLAETRPTESLACGHG